jgi:sigma-B regulation protein RsbU (phosphoserine phosphatase)
MFATLFFGVLNPKTGLLVYVNGGHEPPFVVGSTGFKQRLDPTGPAVGVVPHITFKIKQVQLEPGDTLLGYTDGVSEARSPGDELFTKKRLESLLDQPACSASDLLERIKTSLFVHIDNAQQFDDITMIAVYRAPITQR